MGTEGIQRLSRRKQERLGGESDAGLQIRVFFVCFVALRPESTAMVMMGRSVDLTTLFPGQA